MPELPEVETIRRSLEKHLVGATIRRVDIRRRDVVRDTGAERSLKKRLLLGSTISALTRHGKQLAIIAREAQLAEEHAIVIHLGMSGQLLLTRRNEPTTTHTHLIWPLENGLRLVFRDPRRFGGIWTMAGRQALRCHWAHLGPDALAMSPTTFGEAMHGTTRPIKAALLDQSLVAGIGNIYADESLFAARIHPLTPGNRITEQQAVRLSQAVLRVLHDAIERGGTTLRDYRNIDGRPGTAQRGHKVYGRAGQACAVCRAALRHVKIAQRSTVYCPHCQAKIV